METNKVLKHRSKFHGITLAVMASLMLLLLSGCGDNEMTKNITDAVKKSVASEIDKQGTEIKKQLDQVLNPGADKGKPEEGNGAASAGKEESGKGSGAESGEEKD
jgi:hypothetical protein